MKKLLLLVTLSLTACAPTLAQVTDSVPGKPATPAKLVRNPSIAGAYIQVEGNQVHLFSPKDRFARAYSARIIGANVVSTDLGCSGDLVRGSNPLRYDVLCVVGDVPPNSYQTITIDRGTVNEVQAVYFNREANRTERVRWVRPK